MSSYIIEEPDEEPIRYYTDFNITENIYSKHQQKRYIRVLNQFKRVWYNTIFTLTDTINGLINDDDITFLMSKKYKLFFLEHNNIVNFYDMNKIINRMSKQYKLKKLTKLRTRKQLL